MAHVEKVDQYKQPERPFSEQNMDNDNKLNIIKPSEQAKTWILVFYNNFLWQLYLTQHSHSLHQNYILIHCIV